MIREDSKKDVTIRGVDAELYDQFSAYATKEGITTGELFNIIFSSFLEPHPSPFRIIKKRRFHHIKEQERPEVISDMKELTVKRRDLEIMKGKKSFFFLRINKLIFDKDVDGKLLTETIHAIRKCSEVEFRGNVPKLIEIGLVVKKGSYTYPATTDKLKDITIRKVSEEVYDAFLAKSREEEKKAGELFSETLAFHLPTFDLFEYINLAVRETKSFPLVIRDEEELQVSNEDLEQIDPKKVLFYGIKKLVFKEGISVEKFEKAIGKIIKCKQVFIPDNVPKLLALARTTEGGDIFLGNEKIR